MKKKGGVKKKEELNKVFENGFIQRYSFYILLSLLSIIILLIFHEYIFLEKLYLFKGMASDSINDTYPNYILISDCLRTDGIPKWSFNQGLGQNVFPFSFPDPFVSFLYLPGRENLAYGIAYMEFLKIFLAGIIFYFFLKKRALSAFVCLVGALLYAFSSFIIIGSCWNLFSTEAVYLAFLLFSFEKLYQDNNLFLFPVSIALISILQPFDLWLFGIFLVVYILIRYHEENDPNFKRLFILLLRTGLLAILGVAISSFFFLSEVRLMVNSPRVSGAAGFFDKLSSRSVLGFESGQHYVTAIMRLFSSELLGPSNKFGGWRNFMEAPMFYCGLINLLLVPQLFQFLDERRKKLYGVWMAFFILPVLFPFMRYSFWFFTGDYYRVYSFFVVLILMFFSIQALYFILKNAKIDRKLLLITLLVLLAALYFPYNYLDQFDALNEDLRLIVTVFLLFYTGILLFIKNNRIPAIQFLLLGLICIELITFSKINVNERHALTREEYKQKTGYSDYTNDAVSYLHSIDKGFFRVTKNYSSGPSMNGSLNDAKIQHFKGTGSYHSFNHRYYVDFLSSLNLINENDEGQTRWIVGLRNFPMLHSFVSVKYFLSKDSRKFRILNYDSLTTVGDVKIYRNKRYLPLGFTYTGFLGSKDFHSLSRDQKASSLYRAFIVHDSTITKYSQKLTSLSPDRIPLLYSVREYQNDLTDLKIDTLAITRFSNNHIKGTIHLNERKMLFFSIPYSPGWKALVDGNKQMPAKINIGFMGLLLDKGEHTVELSYTPPLFILGAVISGVSLFLYLMLILYRYRVVRAGKREMATTEKFPF